jgi:hypothetical protein
MSNLETLIRRCKQAEFALALAANRTDDESFAARLHRVSKELGDAAFAVDWKLHSDSDYGFADLAGLTLTEAKHESGNRSEEQAGSGARAIGDDRSDDTGIHPDYGSVDRVAV